MTRDKHPPWANIQPTTTALKSSKTANQTLVSTKQRPHSAPVVTLSTAICTNGLPKRLGHLIRRDAHAVPWLPWGGSLSLAPPFAASPTGPVVQRTWAEPGHRCPDHSGRPPAKQQRQAINPADTSRLQEEKWAKRLDVKAKKYIYELHLAKPRLSQKDTICWGIIMTL